MVNMDEITRRLADNAQAIRALIETVSEEQAGWQPAPETWNLHQVMEHLYNEERIDFRKHLMDMMAGSSPKPWTEYPRGELAHVESCAQGLEGFLAEREYSLGWLRSLQGVDWNAASVVPWGRISMGDVLAAWVAHDYLHIRQINEILYAWNKHQTAPYRVEYAGEW